MAAFNGRWKLTSSEQVGAFSKSIGVSDQWIEENRALGEPDTNEVIDELITTGNESTLVMYVNGSQAFKQGLPLGKEVDQAGLDGRIAKMKVTVEGDKLIRVQSGDGYTATYTRTIEGNNMTQVMVSSAGITGTRKLVKV